MSKSKSSEAEPEFTGKARIDEAYRRILENEPFDGMKVSASMMTVFPHAIACEVPPMDREEFDRLVARVRDYGFREPVVLLLSGGKGAVVEGRHRVAVAWVLGIQLRKANSFGPALLSDREKEARRWSLPYVVLDWTAAQLRELSIDKNDVRRHLPKALDALLACNRYLAPARAEAKERMAHGAGKVAPIGATSGEDEGAPAGATSPGEKASETVARLSGLSVRTIERIMVVDATETPETYRRVWTRDITSVIAAHRAAKDEIAEREKAARAAAAREAASPTKRPRTVKSSHVGQSLHKAIELLRKDLTEMETGVRPVIPADEQRELLAEIESICVAWFTILDADDRTEPDGPPEGEAF